jgi:hypothetical protein
MTNVLVDKQVTVLIRPGDSGEQIVGIQVISKHQRRRAT